MDGDSAGLSGTAGWPHSPGRSEGPPFPDRIFIGKLRKVSHMSWLRAELSRGPSLRSCREALEEAGLSWLLLSGAMVFVHPRQYPDALASLGADDLMPRDVVFAESLDHLVREALARCKGTWRYSISPVRDFGHQSVADDEVQDHPLPDLRGPSASSDARDYIVARGVYSRPRRHPRGSRGGRRGAQSSMEEPSAPGQAPSAQAGAVVREAVLNYLGASRLLPTGQPVYRI